ncbi:hypothetical protein HK405_008857, partial [Cladochytrium tenue]
MSYPAAVHPYAHRGSAVTAASAGYSFPTTSLLQPLTPSAQQSHFSVVAASAAEYSAAAAGSGPSLGGLHDLAYQTGYALGSGQGGTSIEALFGGLPAQPPPPRPRAPPSLPFFPPVLPLDSALLPLFPGFSWPAPPVRMAQAAPLAGVTGDAQPEFGSIGAPAAAAYSSSPELNRQQLRQLQQQARRLSVVTDLPTPDQRPPTLSAADPDVSVVEYSASAVGDLGSRTTDELACLPSPAVALPTLIDFLQRTSIPAPPSLPAVAPAAPTSTSQPSSGSPFTVDRAVPRVLASPPQASSGVPPPLRLQLPLVAADTASATAAQPSASIVAPPSSISPSLSATPSLSPLARGGDSATRTRRPTGGRRSTSAATLGAAEVRRYVCQSP